MPSGKTHAAITAIAGAGLFYAGHSLALPDLVTYALAGGCMAGIFITPDLDVDEPIRSHYVVRKKAGWIAFVLWRLLWLPYAKALPHRHKFSHWPAVSTVIRLIYLALIAWIPLALVLKTWWPWVALPAWWLWAVTGLGVSDGLHWLADIIVSDAKAKIRKKRKLNRTPKTSGVRK